MIKNLGNNILFFKENDKLLFQMALYLKDASQEVRQTARNAFQSLYQQVMDSGELEKLVRRSLNEAQYKLVREVIDS